MVKEASVNDRVDFDGLPVAESVVALLAELEVYVGIVKLCVNWLEIEEEAPVTAPLSEVSVNEDVEVVALNDEGVADDFQVL